MATIIGRQEEIRKLDLFYKSAKAEFLIILGRRRIGKTFLIQTYFTNRDCIFFHVTGLKDGSLNDQIENFTRVIANTFYRGAELKPRRRWVDVFDYLTETINKVVLQRQKVVLFFDELPWMATQNSKLLQAIDHYWNRYWSLDTRIRLIVCGSSASWLLEKLVYSKGGLHNRITYRIDLDPFTLKESKQFLAKKNIKLTNIQILKLYMAMGGVPLYLDQVMRGLSADQNIDEIFFNKRGLLFKEFEQLFSSLFKHHEVIEELIRIIATHRYGISQMELMVKSSKSVGGRLKSRLYELEHAGFIESFTPYHHKEKGIYYRIIDEYTLFYLKWIEPIAKTLRKRDTERGYWQSKHNSASWLSWAGYAYESICYRHIKQIRNALGIKPGADIASWRYSPRKKTNEVGAQIDLLFNRDDNVITICEIKYTSSPFVVDKKYAQDLLRKVSVFRKHTRTNKQIFIAMISANGLKPTMYSEELITAVVNLDNLFK